MDKYSLQDVQNIHNTCFKLNSLQLNALLSNYHCAPDEPYIPPVSVSPPLPPYASAPFLPVPASLRMLAACCGPAYVTDCGVSLPVLTCILPAAGPGADRPRGGRGREHGGRVGA